MPDLVHSTLDDGVLTIRIDRPDVHNAFDESVIAELTAAFRAAEGRRSARCVVLASTGRSFSAGADVTWMKRMVGYSYDENIADARAMAEMLRSIRECPRPVIARVHGAALGGGVGLVAACDVAVAVESALFGLTEVRLGILPAVISPYVAERIGVGAMRRYALTAERFSAAEAHRLGLVSEVVPDVPALDAAVSRFAGCFAANGPEAMAECKRVLRDIHPVDWDAATEATVHHIAQRRISAEGQDGLNAFLDRREPRWVSDPPR